VLRYICTAMRALKSLKMHAGKRRGSRFRKAYLAEDNLLVRRIA